MSQAAFHFPKGFLWGTATASHQVEGNNTNNNWWAWEQRPGKILRGDKSGLACDWWGGRWREDLDRAAAAGQNAHRMSIEWSRVQPTPDRWDEAAIDRYREILRGMTERGLFPLVTLHHFSDPLWVAEKGGWENPATIDLFANYVRKIVEALKGYVTYWVTINEPNTLAAYAYFWGAFPPGKQELGTAFNVLANLASAHAAAYQTIHKAQPEARVSIALHVRPFTPARSSSPLDRLAAGLVDSAFNRMLPGALITGEMRLSAWRRKIPEAKNTLDYLGLNYYTRDCISFTPHAEQTFIRRCLPSDLDASQSGMIANDPEGFGEVLDWARTFKMPILITENGIDDAEDTLRPRYLIEHLHRLWRAVNENYPIKGYFHWTLVDNFEWDRGWTQRFGLWELDVASQARRKRPSADLYAEICRENGITNEMVEKYAPVLTEKMFPG